MDHACLVLSHISLSLGVTSASWLPPEPLSLLYIHLFLYPQDAVQDSTVALLLFSCDVFSWDTPTEPMASKTYPMLDSSLSSPQVFLPEEQTQDGIICVSSSPSDSACPNLNSFSFLLLGFFFSSWHISHVSKWHHHLMRCFKQTWNFPLDYPFSSTSLPINIIS